MISESVKGGQWRHLMVAVLLFFTTCMFGTRGAEASVFSLTFSTVGGAGLVETSTNSFILCGSTVGVVYSSCTANYSTGTVINGATTYVTVPVNIVTASSYAFAGWGGTGLCPTNLPSCSVKMSASISGTVTFDPQLIVSVSTSGNGLGVVTSTDGAVDCDAGNTCATGAATSVAYASGTAVTLVATPYSSSTFAGWSGGGCSGTGNCVVDVSTPIVVVASFTSVGPYTLTVSTSGTGRGTITSSPAGVNCGSTNTMCSVSFSSGTYVTLSASTSSASSYFAGWSNAGCASTGTCTVVMSSAVQSLGGQYSPSAYFYLTP